MTRGQDPGRPGAARRVAVPARPFTATAAVERRMRELGMTAAELADRADVPWTTLKYFGLLSHDRQTLERVSVALDWPPGRARDLLGVRR